MNIKLGDVCQFINGDRGKNYPSQRDISTTGDVPFINAGHLTDNGIDFSTMNYISEEKYNCLSSGKIQNGDLLYCLRGSLGKKAIVHDLNEGAIASSLVIIRPSKEMSVEYLNYVLDSLSIREQMKRSNNGSSQPNLSASSVREFAFNFHTIEEQNQIVIYLNKVKKIIECRKIQLTELDAVIKARFVEMFGDAVHNNKGWDICTVEDACTEIYGGGTPSKVHPEYYEEGDIPWVTSKDMKSDVLYGSQIYINQLGVDNSTTRMIPVNSVIIVIRSGILKHTLPVAINAVPITINQDLKAFIPSKRILARFLAVQFKIHEQDILTGVRAVTADNIEFNSLKQRMIIIPSIDRQQQFVEFCEQVDKSKVVIQKALDEAQLLFDSLMQQYFG